MAVLQTFGWEISRPLLAVGIFICMNMTSNIRDGLIKYLYVYWFFDQFAGVHKCLSNLVDVKIVTLNVQWDQFAKLSFQTHNSDK